MCLVMHVCRLIFLVPVLVPVLILILVLILITQRLRSVGSSRPTQ
eukprot:SAG31_NODE_39_length_31377_cov_5.971482_14_plen_45_part_00